MGASFYTRNMVDTQCIPIVDLLWVHVYGGGYFVASCVGLEKDQESLGASK